MTLSKAALVLLTIGTFAASPALAAGEGKNAQSGRQGEQDNRGGVTSEPTGSMTCFSRDSSGNETPMACPNQNPANNQ